MNDIALLDRSSRSRFLDHARHDFSQTAVVLLVAPEHANDLELFRSGVIRDGEHGSMLDHTSKIKNRSSHASVSCASTADTLQTKRNHQPCAGCSHHEHGSESFARIACHIWDVASSAQREPRASCLWRPKRLFRQIGDGWKRERVKSYYPVL